MRIKHTAVALAASALLAPAGAEAHVSLHPNTVPAGASATLDLRVPAEQEGAYVRKVATLLPPGLVGVAYESVPGWSTRVIETKLAKPIQTDDGPVDTAVSEIVWTWRGPLGKVGDGQFVDFPLSVATPDDAAGRALEFKTVQSYSDGRVVRWIDASLEAEHPAPRINVTAKGGVVEDLAGGEAGPAARQTPGEQSSSQSAPAASKSSSAASKGLAVLALALGALGLIAGLLALIASRRRRSA